MTRTTGAVANDRGTRGKDGSHKTKKSDETRERILAAAARCLNRRGLALTSMKDLAQEVKIKAATIYYYFNSKDELVERVLRIGIEVVHMEVKAAVEALGVEASCREKIQAAIHAHLAALLSHGEFTSANIRNFPLVSDDIRSKNLSVRREYANYWRGLFEEGQRAGSIAPGVDLTLVRLLLIGALNWSTDWYNPRKKPLSEISKQVCDILFDGIAGARSNKR